MLGFLVSEIFAIFYYKQEKKSNDVFNLGEIKIALF